MVRRPLAGSVEPDPDAEEFQKDLRADLDDYERDKAANPDKQWPGLLGEPVFRFSDDFLAGSSEQQRQEDADCVDYELVRRMNLLAVHFGLDPKSPRVWFELALRLASENVPGFMPPKPGKGRPRGFRTGAKAIKLAHELEAIMAERGEGPEDAIRHLHGPLSRKHNLDYGKEPLENFERSCYEALKSVRKMSGNTRRTKANRGN
jgi:hypothetical protein